MRTHADIESAIDQLGDTVWRVCVLFFKESADAQDAFQETFLKYSLSNKDFADLEHRKAWIIVVAKNTCKDMLKSASRQTVSADQDPQMLDRADSSGFGSQSREREVLDAIRALDDPPRSPVYLSLYEGYSAPEISHMLSMPENTVYSHVSRGRKLLKEALS